MRSNILVRCGVLAAVLPAALFLIYISLRGRADTDGVYGLTVGNNELNGIYASVIENNAERLESIAEYGDKFCSPYISVKKDEAIHREMLSKLERLSDEICADSDNDFDKVKKIEYWVADNIYYNHSAAETAVTQEVISLETVLETKTTTCAGYSNLFAALCNMQDIYCINLRGGTYPIGATPDFLMDAPVNHEWNAVLLDGQWIFIDTTWLSNNSYTEEDGYVHSGTMDEQYFHMTLEYMSYEHRIDLADYRDFKSSVNIFQIGEDN